MTTVDVVIPTFNRHVRLARTLAALERQTFRDFGVIVVDDGSSPPVREALDPTWGERLALRVIATSGNGGPGRARNAGIAASTATFVAFVDDDVDPAPDWLEQHLALHREPGRVSFGPLRAPADWRPTPWNWWEASTLAREYDRMAAGVYAPTWRQFFTGNAMVRRADLVAAGGFDEQFTRAEDVELALRLHRLGRTFVFASAAIGWHHARRTLASWLAIPRQYARFDLAIDAAYPGEDWLAVIERELGERRRALRLARTLLGREMVRRVAVPALIVAARAVFRLGQRQLSNRLLSLVYDLEYRAALRAGLRRRAAAGPGAETGDRDLGAPSPGAGADAAG